jgi:hypothetical protein
MVKCLRNLNGARDVAAVADAVSVVDVDVFAFSVVVAVDVGAHVGAQVGTRLRFYCAECSEVPLVAPYV